MALSQTLTPHPLLPVPPASDGHPEAAVASPAQYPGNVSATARREESQHRGYQENLRDTRTWERWHVFTIPCGLYSCSLEVWQNCTTCQASLHYYTWDRCNYLWKIMKENLLCGLKASWQIYYKINDRVWLNLRVRGCYRSMDVEVLVSWGKDILESLLVLRCSCPWWMGCWSGDHHEEWLRVGLIVQEVQGDIGLTQRKKCHPLPYPTTEYLVDKCSLVSRGTRLYKVDFNHGSIGS